MIAANFLVMGLLAGVVIMFIAHRVGMENLTKYYEEKLGEANVAIEELLWDRLRKVKFR